MFPAMVRHPAVTSEFVSDLRRRLETAFAQVVRNDTEEKEKRIVNSECLPDERYEVGDRLLHYRKPTDAEESLKISERWHHVIVDSVSHPRYVVRDATGQVLRVNARFLIRDHTVGEYPSLRRPVEPAAARTREREAEDIPAAESFVVVRSESPTEKWRLAMVTGHQEGCEAGQIRIHYFNRPDRTVRADRQTWRPAYLDTRDELGRDVCCYNPKPWYEAYTSVVRQDRILITGVSLTKRDHISKVDLRRISADPRIDWVFNDHGAGSETVEEGVWVLRIEQRSLPLVGRVLRVEYPRRGAAGGRPRCKVRFEYGADEWITWNEADRLRMAFNNSGFAQTKGWKSATAGVRQLRRLDKRLRRRSLRANPRRDRWVARQRG